MAQRVLLLVDQFEEVFTQCVEGKEKERDSFIEGLVAVGRAQTPLAVVMTMRSDFVNEWLATGQPPEVMNHDAVYLGPLKGEKLRAAIVEPARLQGYNVEPGLLTLLLDDVAKEENCLPLLEFTLQELWEERNAREKALTAMAYVKIGRLKGALDRQAERVFSEKLLREVDRDCARRVCLELVRIGPGGRDTRQRQPKEKLLRMDGESAEKQQVVADVVAELLKGRLLVSGGDEANAYVDVAHEALLEGWKRFVQWRQEGRALRQLLQRLEDAYGDWKEEQQESDEYLLSGGLLAELRERNVAINEALADGRPELMRYFSLSDEREQQKVAALEQALAKADIQEASRKVRDKLLFTPAQTVAATISAISLVGKSQDDFDGRVVYSSQDALHRAWFTIRERLKLEGHSSPVNSVAFSPEGDRIVSGSYDSTLRLWDLKGNAIGKPFEGHSGSVSSVAFSPKGDRIVSGSDDGTLLLWDLEGNTIGFAFEGHNGQILSVAFSPKGDRIVSGSYDNTLRLWDLEGNAIGSAFKGHNGRVLSVAFSPEGDRIVSGSYDNTLQLWDLEGNTVGATFEGHRGPVWSVGFSLQGDRIVSGSDDRTLRLWDLEGNAVGAAFEGHSNRVLSVAFSPEGDRIVSGSYDNTLRLWDLKGNAIGAALEGHENSVLSVAFSPEGDRIVSGSYDNTLRLWALEGNAVGHKFEGHSGSVWSVAFSPEGDRIVSGSYDDTLRIWNLEGNVVGSAFEGHSDWVLSVAFSPKGDRIVSGSVDGTLLLWDLEGNTIGFAFEGHNGQILSVAFSPEGDRIVSGSYDNTLRLWDLEGNAIGSAFESHSGSVWSVAFSPQGDRIVSGSYDNTLRLWDLEGNAVGSAFEGHDGSVLSVAFSPQGDRIVSGSYDNTLRLWDLEGNAVGFAFEGHNDSVLSVAFSPKGDRIVSGSNDGTLRLWDLEGNAVGAAFEGHSDSVSSVAFSSRGDRIISGSRDNTLRLWRVGTWEDELRYCCNMLMHHTALTLPQGETAQQACKVCEQVWTRQQSAQFAVAQGSALARQGDVEGAVRKFEWAKGLDPELVIDAVGRARELAGFDSAQPTEARE